MSGQSLILFVSVLAIAFAANRAGDPNLTQDSTRGPASLSVIGKKDIKLVRADSLRHTHKLQGPLSATIEMVGAPPERAGDVFVLRGVVAADSDLRQVEFTWKIPAGVEVVNGAVTSVIPSLGDGKEFDTQITLRQLGELNERVSLRVRAADDQSRFADVAQYNTLNQEKIEASRKALGESTEALIQEQKRVKVFH